MPACQRLEFLVWLGNPVPTHNRLHRFRVSLKEAVCEKIALNAAADDATIGFLATLPFKRVVDIVSNNNTPTAPKITNRNSALIATYSEYGALSADHLEYTHFNGVKALADAGTVAVLLPGAFLTLGETTRPPVNPLRDEGVPIAIASDCNPGTSPVCSIRTTMTLATTLFGLTPEECLAGVTRNAARALGLRDRGTLETGTRADIAVWDIGHPQELSYWIGMNELAELLVAGTPV